MQPPERDDIRDNPPSPLRLWPQTRRDGILQLLGLSALWVALLTLSTLAFPSHPALKDPPLLPSSESRIRRLLQAKNFGLEDWDIKAEVSKQTQEFFQPTPDLFDTVDEKLGKDVDGHIPEAFFPFNLSGSYRGNGWVNYTEPVYNWTDLHLNNATNPWEWTYNETRSDSVLVSTVIRIRTFVIEDEERFHQAQIRFMLTPTSEPHSDSAAHRRPLMIQASGIYDTLMGKMQLKANSANFPPELPMFPDLNLTYPDRAWPVASKGNFHPSHCQYLVDLEPDSITEQEHTQETSGNSDSDRRSGAYSAIMDREYIDVHVRARIQSLNSTCTNVTEATVEADLLRYDLFILKATKYALIATCLSFGQLLLLFKQMQYSTPASAASKLSLASIAMHSVFDAYLCLIHLTTGLYIDDLFNSFIMVSFLQFMVFSMFDLRLVLLVWRARHPLDFSTGWETMRSTLTKIYSGFYGGVVLCLIFFYYVRHHMNNFVFLLFSFWVPQIFRNVRTGEKFAIQERFLYGVTAIRLFFPLYAFGCPQNFLEFPTNFVVVALLLLFAGFQVLVLKGQDKWGSRFFIPKRFQPDYYEYHRAFNVDPDDDEQCAICMTEFVTSGGESPVDSSKKTSVVDLRKKVLTTPCNHHFCRECLTRWMETKMICPTCRQNLPPYNL